MKRKFILIASILTLIISSIGCSNNNNPNKTIEDSNSSNIDLNKSNNENSDKYIKKGVFLKEIGQEISLIFKKYEEQNPKRNTDSNTTASKYKNIPKDAKEKLEKLYDLKKRVETFNGSGGKELSPLYDEFIQIKNIKIAE